MSFKSTDLMIDVLPVQPSLVLCGQITAGGNDEGDDDDIDQDDLQECGQITATNKEPESFTRGQADLGLLRGQLRRALASETQA